MPCVIFLANGVELTVQFYGASDSNLFTTHRDRKRDTGRGMAGRGNIKVGLAER